MPPPKLRPHAVSEDPATAEARMRRALGINGAAPTRPTQQRHQPTGPRHRFVRDGEVPVEVVTGTRAPDAAPAGRAAALQAALDGERTARAGAERGLAEAQATMQSLRTRLAHAELARDEALAAERRAREQAEVAAETVAARELAEPRPSEAAAARASETAPVFRRATSFKPASRVPFAPAHEPEPVQWWLPGYKASTKGR